MDEGMAAPLMDLVGKLEEVLSSADSSEARDAVRRVREVRPLLRKALLLGLEEAAAIAGVKAKDYRNKGLLAEGESCRNVEALIRARISQL